MSGVVPLVAGMLGPCAAGTAYIPGLSDFVPMVVGQGAMALAGPHLTKAVTGEEISMEDLGGAKVHCRKSGVGDLECKDDAECIEAIKTYLSFFPVQLRAEAARSRDRRPRGPDVGEAARHRPGVEPAPVRHVRGDRARSSTTASTSTSSRGSRRRSSPAWHGSAACRSGSSPTSRSTSAGSSRTTQPTRRRGSSTSATPSASRSSSSRTCPGSWSARRSSTPGSSATGRRCSTRSRGRRCRRSPWSIRKAYGAGYYVMNGKAYEPDQIVRLAERRDLGDGRRGRGQHHRPLGDRGLRRPGGDQGGDARTRSASRSTSTSPPTTR